MQLKATICEWSSTSSLKVKIDYFSKKFDEYPKSCDIVYQKDNYLESNHL